MQSRTRFAASMGALALALFAAACGDNGFATPGQGSAPEIGSLVIAPDTVPEGDTLTITLSATGARNLNQVRFEFRGAAIRDTTLSVPDPAADIDATFLIPVGSGTGPDSLLYLDAFVIDVAGIESEVAQDTVFVVDATLPNVTAATSSQSVGTGDPFDITLVASDNRGLATVGYVVIAAATGDTAAFFTEALAGSPVSYENTYTIVGPTLNPTTLQVRTFAIDRNGLSGESATQSVGLQDRIGPALTILQTTPDSTIPLGANIQVTVEAKDPAGIRQLVFVGLSPIGDPLLGTDTVITRYGQVTIGFPRPGESTMPDSVIRAPILVPVESGSGPLTLYVLAEDASGNVTEVTKAMYVGGPDVSLVYPTKDVAFGVNQSFNVEVRIADPLGIDSAMVFLSGAVNDTLDLPLPASTTSPFVAVQTINLPGTEGTIDLIARAWNTEEVLGQTAQISIDVLQAPPTDVDAPVVSLTAELLVPEASKPRMELNNQLRITVTARDEGNAGLERIGFRAVASRAGNQYVISESTTYGGSLNLEKHIFTVPLDSLYALFGITGAAALDDLLPDEIDLRIHAFAADTLGILACSVGLEEQRPCSPATYTPAGTYEAADTSGLLVDITAVRGHTVLLDNPSAVIADIALDTIDERVFLSNITYNQVELLDLEEDPDNIGFLSPVVVGAQPWGLFVGRRVVSASDQAFLGGLVALGDTVSTLIVGNSGGTNFSLVHLDPNAANIEEVDVIRLQTPNSLLWHLNASTDEFGRSQFEAPEYYDFADRPQFLAQDSLLRIVYSTLDTDAAVGTTIRFAHPDPDPTGATDVPEARFFLTQDMVNIAATGFAIGNVDDIIVYDYGTASDSVELLSHEPGYPDRPLTSGIHPELETAMVALQLQIDSVMTAWGVPQRAPLFYPVAYEGDWNLSPSSGGGDGSVVFSDTTFVSASGDGGRIVIGEGAASPTGRVILWRANEGPVISSETEITDLIGNASERVLGVGLNWNGSLGVVRGAESTYFFTPDLLLQGLYQNSANGGAGAAFHPGHNDVFDGGHTDTGGAGVAFTGTPERSIEVVSTFHFNQVNELFIRDNVVGPLKAGPPLATDNGGLGASCVGDDCVVAKLYGITDAGGVVILNVRRRDLNTP